VFSFIPAFAFTVKLKQRPPRLHPNGIFKQLLDNVDVMNPKSFALPAELRTFFRGGTTGSLF
jgi:hypothetical protein